MAFSEHLTVESYIGSLYLPTVILTVIWYSITHSLFLSRLKTFLLYKSFPLQPFLSFYLKIYYMDSPDCLLLFLGISVFYFQFFLFLYFIVVGSVRQIKLTHVGFRAHVKIASRIVSQLLLTGYVMFQFQFSYCLAFENNEPEVRNHYKSENCRFVVLVFLLHVYCVTCVSNEFLPTKVVDGG